MNPITAKFIFSILETVRTSSSKMLGKELDPKEFIEFFLKEVDLPNDMGSIVMIMEDIQDYFISPSYDEEILEASIPSGLPSPGEEFRKVVKF